MTVDVDIECVCPLTAAGDTRHPDGDRVELRDKLDFRAALAARNSIILLKQEDPDAGGGEVLAVMTESYLPAGIVSWTLVDEKGKKVEPTRQAIRQFMEDHPDEAMEVGDAADSLYSAAVMLPLVRRVQESLQTSRTNGSTSLTTGSQSEHPKPSKPSSTSTTRTGGTGMTSASLVGVSSS